APLRRGVSFSGECREPGGGVSGFEAVEEERSAFDGAEVALGSGSAAVVGRSREPALVDDEQTAATRQAIRSGVEGGAPGERQVGFRRPSVTSEPREPETRDGRDR